jgi:hypothetical protein
MRWESDLYGFEEDRDSFDPVVFKYPARSMSTVVLALSCLLLIGAWALIRHRPAILFLVWPLVALGGVLGVGYAIWSLSVVRRIEVHRSAKKVVDYRRVPLKEPTTKVHDFADIRRISVTRSVGAESGEISDVVVIELESGDHVDFGNHNGDAGGLLALRLQDLTGARVESTS